MLLSALRTPPRSHAITPVLSSSGRSTPTSAGTPGSRVSAGVSKHASGAGQSAETPISRQRRSAGLEADGFMTPRKGNAGGMPRSPRLKSPGDKRERKQGHLCVCEICTCGLHSCRCKQKHIPFEGDLTSHTMHCELPLPPQAPPPGPNAALPKTNLRDAFEGQSVYKRDFDAKELPSCDPPVMVPEASPLPLEGESSYKRDYTEKDMKLEVPTQMQSPKPRQLFYGETSYKKEFVKKASPWKPKRQNSAPACSRRPWEDPLQGTSTYKREYVEKDLPSEPQPAPYPLEAPLALEGESSYRRDYIEKEIQLEARAVVNPKPDQPFYAETSYRQQFGKKESPWKPRRPKSAPSSSSGTPRPWMQPLEGSSTYKREYVKMELPLEPPAKVMPEQEPLPLEGESSYKRDYTEKETKLEARAVVNPKPEQPFYAETSYRQQFGKKESPWKPRRPKSAPPSSSGTPRPWMQPLEGSSTYKREYVKMELPLEPPAKVMPEQEPLPLEGESSYRRAYTEKPLHIELSPRAPARPHVPFCGETAYREHYRKKALPSKVVRRKSEPPATPQPWKEALEGSSTYRREYVKMELPTEPLAKVMPEQQPLPLEGESSYRRDYTEKRILLETPPKPASKPLQPFYGSTSYRSEYTEKMLPRTLESPNSARGAGRHSTEPLGGSSTYRSAYTEHSIAVDPVATPKAEAIPDLRDFTTTYRTAHTPKESSGCPITFMPRNPHHAPDGREHTFWDNEKRRWC